MNIKPNNSLFSLPFSELPIRSIASVMLIILLVASVTPQGAMWFEASMSRHMLIQIPLLIVMGAACFNPSARCYAFLIRFDPLGIIAFVCFTGWLLFWMLPLNLDLATIDPAFRLLKLISVPIGIGICFRWLWFRAHIIVKCVVIFETWASLTRLGWLFIESPVQLCSSYLIGEQRHVGILLLGVSTISAIMVVFYSLFGSFSANDHQRLANSSNNG